MKLSLSHRATAIIRKIEWLGQVTDTNELLAGCVDDDSGNYAEAATVATGASTTMADDHHNSSQLFTHPQPVDDQEGPYATVGISIPGQVDHTALVGKQSQSATTATAAATARTTTQTTGNQLTDARRNSIGKNNNNNSNKNNDNDNNNNSNSNKNNDNDDDDDGKSLYNIYDDGDNSTNTHRNRRKSLQSTTNSHPSHHHSTTANTLVTAASSSSSAVGGGVGGGGGRGDGMGPGTVFSASSDPHGLLSPPVERLLSLSHDSADQSSVTTGVTNRSYSHHRGGWGDREREKDRWNTLRYLFFSISYTVSPTYSALPFTPPSLLPIPPLTLPNHLLTHSLSPSYQDSDVTISLCPSHSR